MPGDAIRDMLFDRDDDPLTTRLIRLLQVEKSVLMYYI